jgi:hypothetical protein
MLILHGIDGRGECGPRCTRFRDLLQIAPNDREVILTVSIVYAAMPKRLWMNWLCPTTSIWMPQLTAKPLIQQGCIALDPAPDGDVIH